MQVKVAIVTTLYNSQKFIGEFIDRSIATAEKIGIDWSFVVVDDGSSDDGVRIVQDRIENGLNATLIKFSKNYGHHKAMMCGLSAVGDADYVFLIDSDLEEEPECLEEFYNKISKSDLQFVVGVQRTRNKNKVMGLIFWKVLNRFLGHNFSENTCTVRIMTGDFVKRLASFTQKDFILGDLTNYLGYKHSVIFVTKTYKGYSAYSLRKKLKMFFDLFFAAGASGTVFTELSVVSFLISVLIFVGILLMLIAYWVSGRFLAGWLSTILLMSFYSALNFLFFSVILKHVSKILVEVENKPRYNVEYILRPNADK